MLSRRAPTIPPNDTLTIPARYPSGQYNPSAKFTCVAVHRRKETSQLYRFTMGTPPNFHLLLLADAKILLNCTDSPWAHRECCMCCCSPLQRNVSTVQTHHRLIANFLLLLADEKKRLDCTASPWAHREFYMCCCSLMQRNVSTVPIQHKVLREINMCCCSPM